MGLLGLLHINTCDGIGLQLQPLYKELSTNKKYSVPMENSMMLESEKCARKFKYEVENKHCRKVESLHTCFLCKLHFGHTFSFILD